MENTTIYVIAFIAALIGIFFISLIAKKFSGADSAFGQKFDERQLAVRSKAYKAGFFSLIALVALFTLSMAIRPWCDLIFGIFACIILSLMPYICICIHGDAYFSIGTKAKSSIVMLGLIGISNILLGVMCICNGTFLEDGLVSFRACSLLCGALLLVTCAAALIHICKSKGDISDESEAE